MCKCCDLSRAGRWALRSRWRSMKDAGFPVLCLIIYAPDKFSVPSRQNNCREDGGFLAWWLESHDDSG
ncbi:unnamed protein product [Urochloa humidicola]